MNHIALRTAGTIFILIAAMHILRYFLKVEVLVAGHTVPLSFSFVGSIFALVLSIWMFKSAK